MVTPAPYGACGRRARDLREVRTIELVFDSAIRSSAAVPRPAELDDADLVGAIRAWERVAAWAAAGQLAAIAELARRRPSGQVAGDPVVPEVSEFAVDEVAAALRLSRPAAGARLHLAVELSRLPATSAALAEGALDLPRARAVVDAVAVLDAPLAAAVERQVLPRAGTQTVGQLRSALSRAVLAADPAAAEIRHERALASRQVTLQAARDGMAELWALLPADAAVAVYQHVDALARRFSADDPRSRDARRADALVTAVLGHPDPAAAPGWPGRAASGVASSGPPLSGSAASGQVRRSTGSPTHSPTHTPADGPRSLTRFSGHGGVGIMPR